MNPVNTDDGPCKLYVQARRTRGRYLLYPLNMKTPNQLYLHTTCISPPRTCNVYIQTLDVQPKIRTAPTNAAFAPIRKCQIVNNSPSQYILSSVVDFSLKVAWASRDISVGQTSFGISVSILPFFLTQRFNSEPDFCFPSLKASVSSDKRMLLCKLTSFPVKDWSKPVFREECSTQTLTYNRYMFSCPCKNSKSEVLDFRWTVFRTESS